MRNQMGFNSMGFREEYSKYVFKYFVEFTKPTD
jgi:hypothetical protein